MARVRNTEYGTVHHLMSRVAHQAIFLKDEERDDFMKIVLRVSRFAGVEPLGWCIMGNHFHLFVYLPVPPQLTDEEILERHRQLKGDVGAEGLTLDASSDVAVREVLVGAEGQTFGASSDGWAAARAALVASIRRRMYSIAEYMRMIKQWFSEDYNARNGHKGTMWAAAYNDHPMFLPERVEDYSDLRDVLAYIHLNPIRAAITNKYDGYRWSSYAAFRSGDPVAIAAIRRAYPGMTDTEIIETHELRMSRLLEEYKRRRADEIARKRMNGYAVPPDPVTDECMVAQSIERIKRVEQEVMQLQLERKLAAGEPERRELICRQIVKLASICPESTPQSLSAAIEVPVRTVQRYISKLLRIGTLLHGVNGLQVSA